jgi:hypothetical protein
MPLTEQEILTDLPALISLYMKIKESVTNPAGINVVPPVDAADKTDVAFAVAQQLTPEFFALVRTVVKQSKD